MLFVLQRAHSSGQESNIRMREKPFESFLSEKDVNVCNNKKGHHYSQENLLSHPG